MKPEKLVLPVLVLALIAVVAVDRMHVSKLESLFKSIEKERIVVSNKLATAKIVSENLNHVQELVFHNIAFQPEEEADRADQDGLFFEFLTTSINDLKIDLISIQPTASTTSGRVTTIGYDLEIEGDFFKFGELCSKFENSRRIVALDRFEVLLGNGETAVAAGATDIRVRMRVNTYRVRKG